MGSLMRIGFHLPIAKGFDHTLSEARRIGCDVVQIFVKNPRSWVEKHWTDRDLEAFGRLSAHLPVVAHLSYLPNIARSDEESRNLAGLLHEAQLSAELGIERMVVHCGSRESIPRGIEVAAMSVHEVLLRSPITVLLENAAGQGKALGKSMDELARIFEMVGDRQRVGFCLDTAHLFEAGYDVRQVSTWEAVMAELEARCGAGSIAFFHLNDSKTALGSAIDRHWHIGRGEIGSGCFRYLLNEKKLAHLGGVMETPKMGNMDEENMKTMRGLLSPLVPGPSS
jgi:apurinic endonuclease APN1